MDSDNFRSVIKIFFHLTIFKMFATFTVANEVANYASFHFCTYI